VTTKTRRTKQYDGPFLTRRRAAAIAAQVLGFGTTWAFFAALGIGGLWGFGIALVAEWLLFEFKRGLLDGAEKDKSLGVLGLVADTVLNAGGIWPWVLNVDGTEPYKMLAQSLTLGETMRLIPALVLALVLGLVLAIAPQRLWKESEE
jgi:hypothetical protein